MPRKRSLDEMKQREVCALVSAGCGIEAAARYVGCNAITIRREAMRDPDFYEQLRKAELGAQLSPLNAMRKAASSNWRAAAWFLERTQPDRFVRRNPRQFTEKQLDAVITQLTQIVSEEVRDRDALGRMAERFAKLEHGMMLECWAATCSRPDVHRRHRQMVERRDELDRAPTAQITADKTSTVRDADSRAVSRAGSIGDVPGDSIGQFEEALSRP